MRAEGSVSIAMSAQVVEEPRRALIAWCAYDWANSAFPTVVSTFIFAAYFTTAVAADVTSGTVMWGNAQAAAGLLIALLAPIMGAVADAAGPRKPYLALFSAVCIAAMALMWFVRPEESAVPLALALVVLATFGFEMGMVFYNAMLPDLAPPSRIGRWSGWGWGFGYMGGLVCLIIALLVFVRAEPPPFGLDPDAAEHVRATLPLAAAWFALFSLPVFLIVPETGHCRGAAFEAAVKGGVANLWNTVRQVPRYANIARYLLAHMIYTDGLNTLFAFGGIYAAGTFGFEMAELILFGIALNVTAGMGAAAFAWMDDRIGARATVLLSLCFIVGLGVPLLLVDSKPWFWVLGLAISVFFGPVQAASRSLMGRLAPETKRAEMFGLHALSGKITAFLGPALLAWATGFFQSQRAGMATIVGLLVVGGLILLSVKEPARR